ncbi:MAG TPA: hypothetical protein VH186_00945 [Chloroflexia bacterium]|nr:hypothetical protein [Chloroflexia bacterium]
MLVLITFLAIVALLAALGFAAAKWGTNSRRQELLMPSERGYSNIL